MYFPIADITISPFLPIIIAFGISFFTSMCGISGAFLLIPVQMTFLGYVNPSVSATNQLYNVLGNPGAVLRFILEKRMIWLLSLIIIISTIPGMFLGALIRINFLPDAKNFKLFVALVLLYICYGLVQELLKSKAKDAEHKAVKEKQDFELTIVESNLKRVSYNFQNEIYSFSVPAMSALGLVVGLIGGIYGVGGGSILSPFIIMFFRLPVHTIAGSVLCGTCVASMAGVIFYLVLAPFYPELSVAPDFMLGILLGIGGFIGMYCGSMCQKYFSKRLLSISLVIILLITSTLYIYEFIV